MLGYNIFRDGSKINATTWTQSTYADAGLSAGTYSYSVTAVYDEGESGPAGPIQVIVSASGLEAPTNLTGIVNDNQVSLHWSGPGGGSEEELIYDNNEATSAYNYPGYSMSTHMSPSGPCQIMTLKYLTSIDAGDNTFYAEVYNWSGSQPGNNLLYENAVNAIEGWLEVDVSTENLFFDGDFVVGFGSENEQTFLAYDADLDNGRSWDRNNSTGDWSSWTETYLIRAVVQYSDGTLDEISAVKGFLGYNLYRDNIKINSSLISTNNTMDEVPTWGEYNYNVTSVFDEGESAYSNTFTLRYIFGVEELDKINISIYPNPASDRFFIRSEHTISKLELISMDGKRIVLVENPGNEYQLSLDKINSGLYILRIENDRGVASAKVLVR